jgi:hypothetical protein
MLSWDDEATPAAPVAPSTVRPAGSDVQAGLQLQEVALNPALVKKAESASAKILRVV